MHALVCVYDWGIGLRLFWCEITLYNYELAPSDISVFSFTHRGCIYASCQPFKSVYINPVGSA